MANSLQIENGGTVEENGASANLCDRIHISEEDRTESNQVTSISGINLDDSKAMDMESPLEINPTVQGRHDNLEKTRRICGIQYFLAGAGETAVKWVNEATETGLPYDIIVGDNENREYIEVKSTKSARKDWFYLSVREWQFAAEKGESFSIAYVVLSSNDMARVTIYKNPVRLSQLGKLRLAMLIPKQQECAGTS
ncbi:hypothetical protein Leryth_019107 [Lithospermum erythrorhizon]|nr:hypothetical protein Leryth_019107 [Lithospermum erythrorhizon]